MVEREWGWASNGAWQIALGVIVLLLLGTLGGCFLFRARTLPAPDNVSATDGTYPDQIRVSWEPVDGATGYEVQRATGEIAPYTAIAATTETSYDDTDVTPGIVYWYRVCALAAGEYGPRSEPATGFVDETVAEVPVPPSGVSASRGDHGNRVVVGWDTAEGATSYEIYRFEEQFGTYSQVGTSSAATYEDTTVVPGRTYWYRVRACADAGCSELSPTAAWGFAALAPEEEPAPPRVVTASAGEYNDKIRVEWSPSVGAAWYGVWRAEVEDGTYERIGDAESAAFDDTDTDEVQSCKSYFYRVTACNDQGCSDRSRAAAGYRGRMMDEAPPPGNVQASYQSYDDQIRVTWSAVDRAVEYEVHITGPNIAGTDVVTVDHDDGLVYKHQYNAANDVPAAEREYAYRVAACGVDDCGTTDLSLPATGRRRGNPLAPEIIEFDPVCANCPQDEEEDEQWAVTVTWEWPWKPWASPNPAEWFEVYRRGPGETEFRKVGSLAAVSFAPPLDYALEEPEVPGDAVTYEFSWYDEDVVAGARYDYRIYAGRTIGAVEYFRRSEVESVRVED